MPARQESDQCGAPWKDADVLRDLYCVQDLNYEQIANRLGCSTSTVGRWINEHGLVSRPWQNKEALETKFYEELKTVGEAAKEFGCNDQTLWVWMKEHNIEPRPWQDRRQLEKFFIDQGLPVSKIASKWDCGEKTIKRWVMRHDLPNDFPTQRSGTVEVECGHCSEMLHRPHWRVEEGEQFCDRDCLSGWLEVRTGEDHPLWEGGRAQYGEGWDKSKKQEVRERDGYECVYCGLSQQEHLDEYGRKLSVHHIIPARQFDNAKRRNAKTNLEACCIPCHRRVEQMAPLRPDTANAVAD